MQVETIGYEAEEYFFSRKYSKSTLIDIEKFIGLIQGKLINIRTKKQKLARFTTDLSTEREISELAERIAAIKFFRQSEHHVTCIANALYRTIEDGYDLERFCRDVTEDKIDAISGSINIDQHERIFLHLISAAKNGLISQEEANIDLLSKLLSIIKDSGMQKQSES